MINARGAHPRLLLSAMLLALAGSCEEPVASGDEVWAAELTGGRVLFMRFPPLKTPFTGTGTLTLLTESQSEPLQITGTRVVDSVFVTFTRSSGYPFTFAGRNVGVALTGRLNGSEFSNVSAGFQRP